MCPYRQTSPWYTIAQQWHNGKSPTEAHHCTTLAQAPCTLLERGRVASLAGASGSSRRKRIVPSPSRCSLASPPGIDERLDTQPHKHGAGNRHERLADGCRRTFHFAPFQQRHELGQAARGAKK